MRRSRLGLGGRSPQIGRRLGPHLAAPEMVGDQLDDVIDTPGEELFETEGRLRVVGPSPTLEHAAVDDVLRQRVLEAVQRFGFGGTREDEVEVVKLLQMGGHVLWSTLENT